MGAAVHRVNVIGEGNDAFVIAFVILEGHLRDGIPVGGGNVDHLGMEHLIAPGFIHKFHEGGDAAFVAVHFLHLVIGIPPVGEGDLQPGV